MNADDLGLSAAVNDAVATGLAAGWLTSATVLANGPAFDDAVRVARAFPAASIGVHLNVTEFAPLTAFDAAWLDEQGHLSSRSVHLPRALATLVEAEWSAQVARVLDAGLRPSHLDAHQHLHHRPALFGALKAVQRRFGIARVRPRGWLLPLGTPAPVRVRARLGAAWFNARLRHVPPAARGPALTASVTRFREALAAGVRLPDTVELMAHPGNPHAAVYAAEVDWLRAGALRGMTLVSWEAL